MTMTALWFGPPERPLFGWLTVPADGRAIGAVILCPPLGDEERRAHRAMWQLSEKLASAGFVVLRFDYESTGDSAGDLSEPNRVNAWVASVRSAMELVRSTGVQEVAAVGMRLGATVATHALTEACDNVRAVVLWDPCLSGREFLRSQQIWRAVLPDTPPAVEPDRGVETPGYLFPPALAAELDRLRLLPLNLRLVDHQMRCLVLQRCDTRQTGRLQKVFDGSDVEWADAEGQQLLLDVPPLDAQVPENTIEYITGWLRGAITSPRVAITVPDSRSAVVGHDNGSPITERLVSLGRIGLFGITTEPAGAGRGPWMVLLNVATEHHIGPGRAWVELSRAWAQLGLRSVRFDLSGIGDSPAHPGQPENMSYAPQWLDDIPEVLTSLSPGDPGNAVLIGLCSGGYGAFEAALQVGARGVCAINPSLSSFSMNKRSPTADPRRRACRPLPVPLVRLGQRHKRTAWWIWRAWRQFAFWQAPMAVPAAAVRSGLDVLLLVRPGEAAPFTEVLYWRLIGTPRLRRTRRLSLMIEPELDHPLLAYRGRERLAQVLTDHLLGRFATEEAPVTVEVHVSTSADQTACDVERLTTGSDPFAALGGGS
jgi:pimeloyl-ACP methyl ester carboxylesterase